MTTATQQELAFLDKFENPGHLTADDRIQRNDKETAGLTKSPMTYEEREALLALARCRFGYGWNNAHRFVRDMTAVYTSDDPQITEGQRSYLWKLVYRFRRQIGEGSELVKMAKEMTTP